MSHYAIDSDVNDYAIDDELENLGEDDLTPVLATQKFKEEHDRRLSRMSVEQIHEEIEIYNSHLDQAQSHVEKLTSATPTMAVEAIRASRAFRQRVEGNYGLDTRFVGERIHSRMNTVFALEEEAEQERGFFRKVIDAIVNAFKWLWKKISSFFGGKSEDGKGDEGGDASASITKSIEKAEKVVKKAKDKEEKVKQAKPESEALDKYGIVFGNLGSSVSGSEVHGFLRTLEATTSKITRFSEQTGMVFSLLITVANHLKSNHEEKDLAEARTNLNREIEKVIAVFDSATGQEIAEAKFIDDPGKAKKAWKIEGMPNGSKIFAWYEIDPKDGTTIYKTRYYQNKDAHAGVVKIMNEPDQGGDILETIKSYVPTYENVSKAITKLAEGSEERTGNLESALKELEEIMSKEDAGRAKMTNVIRIIRSASNTLSGMAMAMSSAMRDLRLGSVRGCEYVADSFTEILKVVDKDSKEEKKEEKADEKGSDADKAE